MPSLAAYEPIVGSSTIDELRALSRRLEGKRVLMVNSTRVGGGVAEILNRMVPLFNELNIDVRWDVIEGNDPYYRVTKKFHNALHGKAEAFTPEMFDLFLEVGRANAKRMQIDHDIVFIHDPQPITLVDERAKRSARWLWRCHIDVSQPDQQVWGFLKPFILKYDAAVYSAPAFVQKMGMRQVLVAPSIDPLAEKNRDLEPEQVNAILQRLEIPRDRPIITQVSRFDYLKDPLGVIEAFKRVRKSIKCRLLLVGGPATDDPEAEEVLNLCRERAQDDPEIHLLMLPPDSNIEINAIQRASAVVVQKSIKEGFGLTVSEALWKGRPVVAGAVGGIPLQVKHRYSGLLVHSPEGCAFAIKQLLNNRDLAKRLGENGREHVRQNFLLTRHLSDYMLAFVSLGHKGDTIFLNGNGDHA
jgi:trehalose synthase